MAIQFIIDSASDILPSQAKELGITHIPLKVLFGEEEFKDAVDLSHPEFYEKLTTNPIFPTTSQIPPIEFMEAYQKVVDAGDTAVVITLSGKLSGTYQSAVLAAADFEGKIFVVDSESVSIGERILLLHALKLREQGLSAGEIAAQLDQDKGRIRLLALLDTLQYLKKGGRISAAAAFAGNLLSIKPVITLTNGEVSLLGKARGSKQGNTLLCNLTTQGNGIDFQMPHYAAYSSNAEKALQKYLTESEEIWKKGTDSLPSATVGCVIGAHAGPGAIAVAFFEACNS